VNENETEIPAPDAPEPQAPAEGPRGSRWLKPDGHLNREALVPALRNVIAQIVRGSRLELKAEIRVRRPDAPPDVENPEIIVNFHGRDADLLLDRGGQLLHALEHVVLRWLRVEPRSYEQVRFDCNDARAARIEELKLAAATAAERVVRSGTPFRFNPMAARERRVIHLALRGTAGVRTASEGEGLRRCVVIYPAESAPGAPPAEGSAS